MIIKAHAYQFDIRYQKGFQISFFQCLPNNENDPYTPTQANQGRRESNQFLLIINIRSATSDYANNLVPGDVPDDAFGDRLERDCVVARGRPPLPRLRLLPHLRPLPLQQHRHVHIHRQVRREGWKTSNT